MCMAGWAANISYKAGGLGKQLKQAAAQNARFSVIVGDEIQNRQLLVKDMASGSQESVDWDVFLSSVDTHENHSR